MESNVEWKGKSYVTGVGRRRDKMTLRRLFARSIHPEKFLWKRFIPYEPKIITQTPLSAKLKAVRNKYSLVFYVYYQPTYSTRAGSPPASHTRHCIPKHMLHVFGR